MVIYIAKKDCGFYCIKEGIKERRLFMSTANKKSRGDVEYTLSRVPYKARRHILSPVTVWIGYCFFPAGIAASVAIGASFSFMQTVLITLAGCVILFLMSGVQGTMGQREGFTFALATRFAWGSVGYKIGALFIPIGLTGWSSIHLNVAAGFIEQVAGELAGKPMPWAYYASCIVFALVFGFVAIKGFKIITIVSYVCVSVVIVLLAFSASKGIDIIGGWNALFEAKPVNPGSMTVAAGITSMVGTFACGDGAASVDIQRFNKTPFQAWVVAFVTFCIAYPFLMLSGAITALATRSSGLVEAYIALSLLSIGCICIAFLTWTTVDTDFYSSSLSFSAVIGGKRERAVAVIATFVCILSLFKPSNFLTGWLTAMAAIMIPLIGIAAADYYIVNKARYPEPSVALEGNKIPKVKWCAVISLIIGAATLVLSNRYNFLIPPINCIIMSAASHVLFAKILPQKANFNALIDETARKNALEADA
jgi:cytosine permease